MDQKNAVIFDLDGTLLNTLNDLTDSLNYALRCNGFCDKTPTEVKGYMGNGVSRLVESSIVEGCQNPLFEKCISDFQKHYIGNMQNTTQPYQGIEPLIRQLFICGFRLAVVSNKPDKAVKQLIQKWFGSFINVAIGESNGRPKKPDPTMIHMAIEKLGTKTDCTIYVGDSEIDIQTAMNARIPFIGVTWGFRDRLVLINNGASTIADTPYDLANLLLYGLEN